VACPIQDCKFTSLKIYTIKSHIARNHSNEDVNNIMEHVPEELAADVNVVEQHNDIYHEPNIGLDLNIFHERLTNRMVDFFSIHKN
jgi:hypothetical protein